MKIDYIIVGCGLAGINFCEQLLNNNKTFVVIDNKSQQASTVAGGLYNPVTLKRFTPVWKSKEQLKLVLSVYSKIEKRLKVQLDYKMAVCRRFTSLEEQNDWFSASDKIGLEDYLSTKILKNNNASIDAKFGLGKVLQTGRIDTKLLISEYRKYLLKENLFIQEEFDFEALRNNENTISYKDFEATHIVFAEGFGLNKNPFFNKLPLEGAKGELITIHAPNLKLDYVLKSSVFVIPLGNDIYRIGSTYDYKDRTNAISQGAKEELIKKLKTFVCCEFKVVDQVAGIRPTVRDRRALIGTHKKFKNYHIINGLGTRGVMIGPYVAKQLFNSIENKEALDDVINISRFEK